MPFAIASSDSEDQSTVHLHICLLKSVETYSTGVCSVFCLDIFRCFWMLGTLPCLPCYLVHLSPWYITFNASNVCLTLATVAAWPIIYINFHWYGHSNHGSKWPTHKGLYITYGDIYRRCRNTALDFLLKAKTKGTRLTRHKNVTLEWHHFSRINVAQATVFHLLKEIFA